MNVGFVGAGSWGTTLAVLIAARGHRTRLWAHGDEQRMRLARDRQNSRYLPGVPFPESLQVVESIEESLDGDVVVIATPTQYIRSVLGPVGAIDLGDAIVVSASKGIERGSLYRVSEIVEEAVGVTAERFVSLSGPSHAEEVAAGIPTTIVAASTRIESATVIQELFTTDTFRVYTSDDLVGVELGGALKNVIALCAGIIDGLGFGDNTKAALITRGLAEITRLGVTLGAKAATFSGLSGLGDLVVTCTSRHSRNRFVGEQIGRGRSLSDVQEEMRMVAEGVATTASAHELAIRSQVEMPITNEVYQILFQGKDPRVATRDLMTREPRHEIWT